MRCADLIDLKLPGLVSDLKNHDIVNDETIDPVIAEQLIELKHDNVPLRRKMYVWIYSSF